MRDETNLIMCRFPLPENQANWKLIQQIGEGIDAAWLYRKYCA
jgi:hypothetical protein